MCEQDALGVLVCVCKCMCMFVCKCKVLGRSPRGELRKEGDLGCSVVYGDRRGASAQQPQRLTWGLPVWGSTVGGEGSCRPSGVGLGSFQGTFRRTASGFLKPLATAHLRVLCSPRRRGPFTTPSSAPVCFSEAAVLIDAHNRYFC